MNDPLPLETVASGRFLRLMRRGRWEFAQRTKATGVVAIAALTREGKILLVEQYRPPVEARVVELPAGLAGDSDDVEGETLATAAHRELLEETGYRAGAVECVLQGASSAGLTDEVITFCVARDLERIREGGGHGGEQIEVHEVELPELDAFIQDKIDHGRVIDSRVYSGVYLLKKRLGC